MSLLPLAGVFALGVLVHRRMLSVLGGGTPAHLARLPGNLLHELAHAVVTLACGYTVVGFSVSLFDPRGRGEVRPGPPWTRFARPWFANLLAPVAPAVAGVLVLDALFRWSGAPGLPTSAAAVGPVLRALPLERWELWVSVALAFSVCEEMWPSDIDFRAWRAPALVAAVVAGLALWGAERVWPGVALAGAGAVTPTLSALGARALAIALWSTLAWAPLALLAAIYRRS